MADETLLLFSPLYDGSDEAWFWLSKVTNGRPAFAQLNPAQLAWAYNHGYHNG